MTAKCSIPECHTEVRPGWAVCERHVDYFAAKFGTKPEELCEPVEQWADWAPGELQEAWGK